MSTHPRIGIRPTIDGRRQGVRESLEDQTMGLAQSVAALLSSTLRYPDGEPVECVVAESTIGRVNEAAACAQLFKDSDVGLTITVTPCWCYGTETMDMDPTVPHAVWGFNGSERPGAVYLAAVLAAHAQKGIPAFGIYGQHVQDADDSSIPDEVAERLLDFARAGLATALMRGRSYLSIGAVSMGIAGSVVKDDFFAEYLGMRNEYVESVELLRRIDQGIYDEQEYEVARAWVREHCVQGEDRNSEHHRLDDAETERQWDVVVKMALIARDLMVGNPALADKGFVEEAGGFNAILAGFQGQRQWTDYQPNGDFLETILNTNFDWTGTRQPTLVATENDSLNGVSMLFGHLLTNTPQIFSDVRTYWSPEAVERVTGHRLEGLAAGGIIDLRNSGATTLDGSGKARRDGEPVIKPWWELTPEDVTACLEATTFHPSNKEYFRGGGFSTHFVTEGGMPVTMARVNLVRGLGPVLQVAEGWTVDLPEDVNTILEDRTDPLWPTTWFVPRLTGQGSF
ncbi:MAG TPA: L-fucose isomerase, partial [Coriobacteriia bacterium]|nr:L-fucose isomerase [Coriobacteriia bacterium]